MQGASGGTTVAGTLIGNIVASEEVSLLHTGKGLGNITTPKLSVEPGVITEGKVTITLLVAAAIRAGRTRHPGSASD